MIFGAGAGHDRASSDYGPRKRCVKSVSMIDGVGVFGRCQATTSTISRLTR